MTTIVYCHKTKQIAVDSRSTMGTRIVTDEFAKHHIRDGHHFFIAGSITDIEYIMSAYLNKETKWTRERFSALVVSPDDSVQAFYNVDSKLFVLPTTFNDGYGSGGDWALAALDFGQTPLEAVRYAATKDNCTGGAVLVFDIQTGSATYYD